MIRTVRAVAKSTLAATLTLAGMALGLWAEDIAIRLVDGPPVREPTGGPAPAASSPPAPVTPEAAALVLGEP